MLTLSSFKASCVINYCSSSREMVLLAIKAIKKSLWLKLRDSSELDPQPKISSLTGTIQYAIGCRPPCRKKKLSYARKAPLSNLQIANMSMFYEENNPSHSPTG